MNINFTFPQKLTFGYKKMPVRVFSNTENSKRYDSVLDASKGENIDYRNISRVLKEKTGVYNGKVFLYADSVEDENCDIDLAKASEKVNEKLKNANHIPPFWQFKKDGSCIEFKSINEMSEKIGVSPASIWYGMSGKSKTVSDSVVLASDSARFLDENGKISYDFDLIQELAKERFESKIKKPKPKKEKQAKVKKEKAPKIKPEKENKKLVPVYMVSPDMPIKRFDSIFEAARDTNIAYVHVSNCTHGKIPAYKGAFFVPAKEVEIKDENGNIELDLEKIAIENQKRQDDSHIKRIYLINEKGEIEKVGAPTEPVTSKRFYRAINNGECGIKDQNGKFFVCAKEIETLNEEGKIVPDMEKIKPALVQIELNSRKKTGIWALCPDGTFEFYKNADVAADENETATSNIRMCAGGFSRYAKGKIFFKSGDIEKIDEEGKIVPDLEKCKKILLERKLNYMADEIF